MMCRNFDALVILLILSWLSPEHSFMNLPFGDSLWFASSFLSILIEEFFTPNKCESFLAVFPASSFSLSVHPVCCQTMNLLRMLQYHKFPSQEPNIVAQDPAYLSLALMKVLPKRRDLCKSMMLNMLLITIFD